MDHVDYPHEAGYLYDCPACESQCFCEHDLSPAACVWCEVYCDCTCQQARWPGL
jgi:hypothetical protein